MRFLTYRENGKDVPAVLTANGVVSFEKAGIGFDSVLSLVKSGKAQELEGGLSGLSGVPLDSVELTAPIPYTDGDVICLGINYTEHAKESARYEKSAFERDRDYPVYFSKRVDRAKGSGEAVSLHGDITERVDYEAELAVIIGKDAKNVRREDAYSYVFGYTVLNDVSARDIQTRHKQWYFGKSLDGFCCMGPVIVTHGELGEPTGLGISSRVNGELRQNSTTSLMVFDIPYVIGELSKGMTLRAGTVISMGTPAGVGMGFDPPRFIRDGDEVVCEIEKIGKLVNKFVK